MKYARHILWIVLTINLALVLAQPSWAAAVGEDCSKFDATAGTIAATVSTFDTDTFVRTETGETKDYVVIKVNEGENYIEHKSDPVITISYGSAGNEITQLLACQQHGLGSDAEKYQYIYSCPLGDLREHTDTFTAAFRAVEQFNHCDFSLELDLTQSLQPGCADDDSKLACGMKEWFYFMALNEAIDVDFDGKIAYADNCPLHYNPGQANEDKDVSGDACDDDFTHNINDADGDSWITPEDNCKETFNPLQADLDGDGLGDVCDDDNQDPNDFDGDGIVNDIDNCHAVANDDQTDTDGNGLGDACDCPNDNLDADGVCGCGHGFIFNEYAQNPEDRCIPDVDSDGDNTKDHFDTCPNDPFDTCNDPAPKTLGEEISCANDEFALANKDLCPDAAVNNPINAGGGCSLTQISGTHHTSLSLAFFGLLSLLIIIRFREGGW